MIKKYKTIFLDQDGTLCSFTSSVIKQVNSATGSNVTLEDAVNSSRWDLEHLWGMSQSDWWNAIDLNPNFWLEIEPFPWANQLVDDLKNYCDELVILTAPSQNPNCISQKLIWLKKHLNIPSRNVITGKKKYLLAREDALLVDDSKPNCDSFVDNGGNAVLIPSDWNTLHLSYSKVWNTIHNYLYGK